MTETIRPDVGQVLGRLKDFQRATAQYAFDRLYGESDPVHRFLVADEVGLGKTHVAKGVIAMAVDKVWDSTQRIDVIYICSNSAIARQNINKLNVVPGSEETTLASRITMLPVELKDLTKRKLNFISFTPATSFDLRSSLGMMDERAVLFRLLESAWGVKGAAPKNALQGTAGKDRFRALIDYYHGDAVEEGIATSFAEALAQRTRTDEAAGKPGLRSRWENLCEVFSRASDRANRPVNETRLQVEVVGELRDILATTCLKALEPDLIILDEFQRFKHLLGEESEESRLARDLFNYVGEDSRARVLLLSATPYKMLTGSDEPDGEDHYKDFLDTVRFLQNDPARTLRCTALLQDFRRQLLRFDPAAPELREFKNQLEGELRRVMVRTERLAITPDRDGMLRHIPSDAITVSAAEASSYRSLGRITKALDQPDPVEYWKSSPYLLSFMEGYELKKKVKDLERDPATMAQVAGELTDCPGLLFPWADYTTFAKVDPGNGRMRWLIDRFVTSGAWQLLWVPPARPWYRLEGPFAELKVADFTKLLVFSSWNVVPKAIATLTSYAVEREMLLSSKAPPEDLEKIRTATPLLRFERGGSASLLTLIYPSFGLARIGAESQRVEGEILPSRDDLLHEIEGRLRVALSKLPDSKEGREDERWYWAAPALLDQREDPEATLHWFDDPQIDFRLDERELEAEEVDAASRVANALISELRTVVSEKGATLGRRPADLPRVLAELALAGPAISALRALTNLHGRSLQRTDVQIRRLAGQIGYAFRSYFNLSEITAFLRASQPGDAYWRQVLNYCVIGGLGAVLEEYVHVLNEWMGVSGYPEDEAAQEVAEGIIGALTIRTANPGVDTIASSQDGASLSITNRRLRSRFAVRLGEDTFEGGKGGTRTDQIRNAFNSPFWPFVLATTSVGQEGLDFHLYCHAVAHWNLPSNPVDLEQREGRVHRFKGHAVRKNVSARHGTAAQVPLGQDPWQAMFDSAVTDRPAGASDLSPYWIYPLEGGAKIERHVPLLPLSRDVRRYARLRRSVTLYRMVFGQPRQEDLLEFLMSELPEEEARRQADSLRLDLGPR